MNIIVTGATGSCGAYLVRHFSNLGHKILATGQANEPHINLRSYADYLKADIRQSFKLPKADVIIHTAALSDDKAKVEDLYKANVIGTSNVIKAAKHIPTFIHISSSSVYLPDHNLITEDMAGKQQNEKLSPYGYSKLQSEQIIHKEYQGNRCFILRPRALYGIGDKVILPRMLKLVKNETLQCPGSMKVNLSMTHYGNLCRAIEACLNASDKRGIMTYNVSDEPVYVLIDIMRNMTSKLYGIPLDEKQIPIFLLKFLSWFQLGGITPLLVRSFTQDMVLDISKIKKELNFKPFETYYNTLDDLSVWIEQIGGIENILSGDKKYAWQV